MSEAAVAEQATQEQQTGQQTADENSLAGEQQQSVVDPSLAGGEQPSGTEATSEDESSEGDDFSYEAILKEAGIEPASTPDDRQLPGKSYEDIQKEAEQAAWNEVSSFRTTYLQQAQEAFMDQATNGGMTREAADKLWQAISNDFKTFDQKHWAAKVRPFTAFAKSEQVKEKDPEAYEIFSTHDYAGNPIDIIAGAMAAGRKAELARLQKKGEHIPPDKLEKIVTVAKAKGVAEAEAKAKARTSGNNNGVTGGATANPQNEDAILADPARPQSEKDAILRRRGML